MDNDDMRRGLWAATIAHGAKLLRRQYGLMLDARDDPAKAALYAEGRDAIRRSLVGAIRKSGILDEVKESDHDERRGENLPLAGGRGDDGAMGRGEAAVD